MTELALVKSGEVQQQERLEVKLDQAIWGKVFETINYIGSIRKGHTMSEEIFIDGYSMGLPLCQQYFSAVPICAECPVRKRTGRSFCGGTPLKDFLGHWKHDHNTPGFFGSYPERIHPNGIGVECSTCRELIDFHIQFLKSLFFGDKPVQSRGIISSFFGL